MPFDPAALLMLTGGAWGYLTGVRRLGDRGRRWPVARSCAFAAGWVALAIALLPPLASADDESFTAHVAQHLLLGMAAPLLLALSAPVTLALQAADRPQQRALLAVVRSRPVVFLTHPLVSTALFAGSMFALYLTPLLEASVEHLWLHALVHVHVFAVGCLFFWPLVSPDPVARRLPYPAHALLVLLTVPVHAVLGMALVAGGSAVAPDVYADLGAQRTAGGTLWAAGDLLGLAAGAVVLSQWMRAEDRATARDDRRLDAAGHPTPAGSRP